MGLSAEDIAYATDLFSGLGDITTRRMMGGLCLYHDGIIFAMFRSDGEILIKGAGDFVDHLTSLGCEQWIYTRKTGAKGAMPYWTMPEAARDDPEEAVNLARQALQYLT